MASNINVSAGFSATNWKNQTVTMSVPDYAKDFAPSEDVANKVVLQNITSPIDQPQTARIERSNVSNIYRNTDIVRSLWATSTRGYSLVAQVNDIYRITDTTDSTFMVDLPVSAHWVLKVPATPYLSAAEYLATLNRAYALVLNQSDQIDAATMLDRMLRGVVNPLS